MKLEPEFVWDIYCCSPSEILLIRVMEIRNDAEPRVPRRA